MRRSRSTGITLVVAILIVGLATPAAAKKGGHPGPPSNTGLEVTVEPRGVFMWANSVGDHILFDITVTNSSGGPLTDVQVDFSGLELITLDLAKNESWTTEYTHTITGTISTAGNTGDFEGAPIIAQSDITVGIVSAAVGGEVLGGAPAVTTAYPVLPCPQLLDASFTWGPSAEDYSVCALTPGEGLFGYWTFETTLPKPKKGKGPVSPAVTVRDGVPGNWCDYDEAGPLPQDVNGDRLKITDRAFFPTDPFPGDPPDTQGVCLHGGAGGDTIPVRNHETFYLATWEGNVVEACPGDLQTCPPEDS